VSDYALLYPQFSDLDSPLFHGVVTQYLSRDGGVAATDPTGAATLASPPPPVDCFDTTCDTAAEQASPITPNTQDAQSSKMRRATLIAIVVGVCGGMLVALLIAAGILVRRHKLARMRCLYDTSARSAGVFNPSIAGPSAAQLAAYPSTSPFALKGPQSHGDMI